ncbi:MULTISPECIES: 4-alpha-glucanotransferase [unclassified Ketobacter]|uniref:4-alpha-glucanotransferase n=1 Tax=unclassified Ketobacter TaxID=2639109 RepID=UPI000F21759A|nr:MULTISPECIES: 4-alpha-glucanotransferase [unclassified Ketobacter]RLT89841.1 MAG: 4-alpha-glucanotransferase [Ketobacter sp. GenoA1]RLT98853.1 MAG: 4-alpha-glucanotransferase [Ketobacter sp.]
MPKGILNQRLSGVILHPTSLPGKQHHGSFGQEACNWINWLQLGGFGVWQILPLCPVADGSPYNSISAFSGNPSFIDIAQLQALELPVYNKPVATQSQHRLALVHAFEWLQDNNSKPLAKAFAAYQQATPWLQDASLFTVIKHQYPRHWQHWPQPLRDRDEVAIRTFCKEHQHEIELEQFIQFLFHRQWQSLKQYANERDILVFGDLPIFVSADSADVWANRHLFKLHEDGSSQVIAGVPPDYFSSTGQRWGNPIYHWEAHRTSGFHWWKQRLQYNLELYDAIRIDHFRGFVAYWEIPADEPTAMNGRWVTSPGTELFEALLAERSELPLIAEDLGIITEDVIALRKRYGLPGMKILQFAFDSDGKNPYLPHNHTRDTVIYTGTHDNNTTLGWYQGLPEPLRERINQYFAHPNEPMPWPLIKSALASPARWAMMPFQDLLELDAQHRMNTPGTTDGNWRWRFHWDQVDAGLADRMKALNVLYSRQPG